MKKEEARQCKFVMTKNKRDFFLRFESDFGRTN